VRHGADCPKVGDRDWKRCRCPRWLYWRQDGKAVRQAAKTRSWEKAQDAARQIEERFKRALGGDTTALQDAVTIEGAVRLFLEDKSQQGTGDTLRSKLKRLLEVRFVKWAAEQPITRINTVTLAHLEEFRKTWPGNDLTRQKTQELLRSFFNFCLKHDWIRKNPAALLSKIRVETVPTDYFNREEFDKIIAACDTYTTKSPKPELRRAKVKALILLMRWSGLRAGDAIKLERSKLIENKILLRMEKTGEPVWCPIPPDVAERLRNLPNSNPAYFFWSGNGSADSAYSDWHRTVEAVFEEAALRKRCHFHMLRDTFAVELLLAGVPIEQVSMLLGHRSVRTTQRHYAPWVRARQEQLEASVKKTWDVGEKKPKKKPKKKISEAKAGR
jgi:integrase